MLRISCASCCSILQAPPGSLARHSLHLFAEISCLLTAFVVHLQMSLRHTHGLRTAGPTASS